MVGGYLHAHHVREWEYFPALRYDVDNGITLCIPCHRKHHESRSVNRKITDDQVAEMRALRVQGVSLSTLAAKYGISQGAISNICSGKKRKTSRR